MTKTLELPVNELKQALAGLAKVIAGKSSLPILGHVRVEPDGPDAVCLQGTDLDAFVTCRVPARNPDNFPACTVAFAQLAKLVKASKGDLALVREENGRINVRYPIGASVAKTPIDSLPIGEWPMPPGITAPESPLTDAFKPALKQALECASRDSSRYILNGVCLDVTQKDCHTVVGTDGRHLFAANTFSFQLPTSVTVPEHRFLNWAGFAEDGPWRLAVELDKQQNPAWVRLRSDHWTFVTKAIDGNYPNWRQIVPVNEGKTRLRFSPASVETILDALPCLPSSSETNMPVVLEAAGDQFCLKGHSKESMDCTQVPVAGVSVSGPGFRIAVNRKYLSRALRFGFVDCDVYSEFEPLQFTAPGRKLIVSPLHCGGAPETPTTAEPQNTEVQGGAPAATEPNPPEERKTMTDKPPKKADSPLREAVERIEQIKETLKSVVNDFNAVLAIIKVAEKEKKATEKEVEAVRATLRSLQKVEI